MSDAQEKPDRRVLLGSGLALASAPTVAADLWAHVEPGAICELL